MKCFRFLSLVLFLGLLVPVFIFGNCSFAGGIGYIDVQKVFSNFDETRKAQEKISKQEDEYKKELESRQKKIEEAKESKLKESEIKDLIEKLEKELNPKKQELLKLNAELTGKLQQEIVSVVSEVAKTLGIDVVVDKQAVISGGIDVTDIVVNKLNKKKNSK
jgi:outer membrane protein